MTDQEKQALKNEIITEVVPEIVKNIVAELEKGKKQKEDSASVDYKTLVQSAMK